MPLTDYQAGLARLLSENRTFDSYLADGAAILIEPNTNRFSRDLDYFHDSEARVAKALMLGCLKKTQAHPMVCRGFLKVPRAQGVGANRRRESLILG